LKNAKYCKGVILSLQKILCGNCKPLFTCISWKKWGRRPPRARLITPGNNKLCIEPVSKLSAPNALDETVKVILIERDLKARYFVRVHVLESGGAEQVHAASAFVDGQPLHDLCSTRNNEEVENCKTLSQNYSVSLKSTP